MNQLQTLRRDLAKSPASDSPAASIREDCDCEYGSFTIFKCSNRCKGIIRAAESSAIFRILMVVNSEHDRNGIAAGIVGILFEAERCVYTVFILLDSVELPLLDA